MNRLTKLMTCLLIGLFLANGDVLLNEAAAQPGSVYRDPAGRVTLDGGSFESRDGLTRQVPFGTQYRVYSQMGNGIGWNDGQTYFNVFHPFHINPWVDLVFVDVRGWAAYENLGDGLGANLGVGYRRYVQPWNTIFGISGWGDVDGAHEHTYYQAGVSGEIITPVMEYRVNGYFGVGSMTHVLAQGTAFDRPLFQQHFAFVNNFRTTENSYEGVDAEMGGPIPYLGRRGFNAYVGGYYLRNNQAGSTAGVKFRSEIFVHEDVQLGMEYRYDDVFRNSLWGNVMVQFPNSWRDWFRKPFFLQRSPAQHLARQVERQYRIPTKVNTELTPEILRDPIDGSPLIVIHVNPDGPPGDGSAENPFNAANFANRSDANIIRVLPGNFRLNRTLDLFDNQRLLAANHQHQFFAQANGQIVQLVLPGQVFGPNPTISNSVGADVVRLANNTEVSGFDVLGGGRIGIIGDNISDFNVNRLNISQSLHGIQITNFHETNRPIPFGQRNLIQDVTVSGSSSNGVALNMTDGGTGSVWVNRLNSGGNAHHGLSVSSVGGSNVNLVLTGSQLGTGNGLPGNGQDGFNFAADSGSHVLVLGGDRPSDANVFSGNSQRGADIVLSGTAVGSITAINNVFGATAAGNALDGLRVQLRNSAQLNNSRFDRNTFSSNGGIGMHLEAFDNALVDTTCIANSLFTANTTGLMVSANDSSLININFLNNAFLLNNGAGLHVLANGGTVNVQSLIGQMANGNAGDGLRLEATNGGLVTLANAFGNTSTGNTLNGMLLRADGAGSRLFGSMGIDGLPINSFTNNMQAGLLIEAINDGTVAGADGVSAFGLLAINASNNAAGGLDALVNGTGAGTMGLSINQSNFDANTDFGIRVRSAGFGVLNALQVVASSVTRTVDNPATNAQGDGRGDGILLVRSDSSVFGGGGGVNIGSAGFGNVIMSNAGAGIRVFGEGNNNAVNQVNVLSNMVLSNGTAGMRIEQTADSVFVYSVRENLFQGNQDGVHITTSNNAAVGNIYTFDPANSFASASVFDGNEFLSNTRDGILIETPLANNQSWQNIAVVGLSRRTLIAGNGRNGITINNNSTPTVDGVNPQRNIYTIQGTDIANNTQDGINITLTGGESAAFPEHAVTRGGTNQVNIGGPAAGQNVNIVDNGGEGVQVLVRHQDTGIRNGVMQTFAVPGTDIFNVDTVVSARNASDGFQVVQQGISDVTLHMFRSMMLNNGGVGLSVNIASANAPFVLSNTTSVYNIGSDVAGTGNVFSGNALQGVFFQTFSPVVSGADANSPPIIANTFISLDNATAPMQPPQVILDSGFYADARNANNFVFTTGRFNFFGNLVRNNGSAGNDADGVAISVGTNTRMFAAISANTFSGNAGASLNIVNVRSQNPGSSIDNFVTGPNGDLIYTDPIGQLDLALGLNFVGVDPPVSGEAPTGALPNIGEQFTISTVGITTPLAGRTELGIFTNVDTVSGVTLKPANRNSFMIVRVYDANPSVLNQNMFPQSGPVITTFMNANRVIGGGGNPPGGPIPLFNTIQFQPLGAVFP